MQATSVSQQHLLLLLLQSQQGQQPALPKKGFIWAQPSCLTTMCQLTWHQWERRGAELMSVWRYENLTQLPSEALLIQQLRMVSALAAQCCSLVHGCSHTFSGRPEVCLTIESSPFVSLDPYSVFAAAMHCMLRCLPLLNSQSCRHY